MRTGKDEYRDGQLWNGYDYSRQSWVANGLYVRCGHPESIDCGCYGKLHAGQPVKKN